MLHHKVLRVSFCCRGINLEDQGKLELKKEDLSKDQCQRVIPGSAKITDILIPFDKIGHEDELLLLQEIDMTPQLGTRGQMPGIIHNIKI